MKTQPQCNSKTREPAPLADARDLPPAGDLRGAQTEAACWQEIARDRDVKLKDLRRRAGLAAELLRAITGLVADVDLHAASVMDTVVSILGGGQ